MGIASVVRERAEFGRGVEFSFLDAGDLDIVLLKKVDEFLLSVRIPFVLSCRKCPRMLEPAGVEGWGGGGGGGDSEGSGEGGLLRHLRHRH